MEGRPANRYLTQMHPPRDLAILCDQVDWKPLLVHWQWRIPNDHVPILLGAFGDWIFAAPDGSIWALCLLESDYRQVAGSTTEFDQAKLVPEKLEEWFKADWVVIAAEHGMVPSGDECLGWDIHPRIGGPFSVNNISVYSLRVYQTIMGQLHRQIDEGGPPSKIIIS